MVHIVRDHFPLRPVRPERFAGMAIELYRTGAFESRGFETERLTACTSTDFEDRGHRIQCSGSFLDRKHFYSLKRAAGDGCPRQGHALVQHVPHPLEKHEAGDPSPKASLALRFTWLPPAFEEIGRAHV